MAAGRLDWLPVVTEDSFWQMVGDEAAASLPAGHPDRGEYLQDYGTSVAEVDLDRAIEAMGMAVSATAQDDAQRAWRLLALAYSLDRRYGESRSTRDLDQAAEALEVVNNSTYSHALQTESQDLLVRVLKQRYEATASIDDLNKAISVLELIIDNTRRGEKHSEARAELLSSLRRLRRQDPSGRILIYENEVLGYGSNGTIVYRGTFDGREVAVKRVPWRLDSAPYREIDMLRKIDGHPHVIRYYYQAVQSRFHCIAIDRCWGSLADVVTTLPSADLPRLLLQIALGLGHLHAIDVVHRDLKPNNILLRDAAPLPLRLVLSDFGVATALDAGRTSQTVTSVAGTFGWKAPELLLALDGLASAGGGGAGAGPPPLRASKTNDIFSLGLVFFYVLTWGRHPFANGSADEYMRELNIRRNRYNLGGLDDAVAENLIESMLCAHPADRPPIRTVLAHPFFWDAAKRLAFLCKASDDLEPQRKVRSSTALAELERVRAGVFTGSFLHVLPPALVNHATKKRKYNGTQLQELLRLVRNMNHHYHEQPAWLQTILGSLPEGFMAFWTTHFPNLFLRCWSLSRWETKADFAKYYEAPTHA